MTLQEALEEFLFQKKLAGLAPASLKDYENIITIMLDSVGSWMPLDRLTYKMVTDYILTLYDRPLSRATVATYIRNIRIFLRWIYVEYGLAFDPVRIKVPKSPKRS